MKGWSICVAGGQGRCLGGTGPTDLFQQAPLLDNVRDGLHLDALRLIYVLESIEILGLLVLYHTDLQESMVSGAGIAMVQRNADLAESALADTAEENKVE